MRGTRQELELLPAAELRGVVHRYGRVLALDGVDLALAPGQVTALLGPNGAGKTTAVKVMMGLVAPTAGTARIFGGDPAAAVSRMRLGAMMQVAGVPATLKVREHLELFRSYYPRPLPTARLVERTGLGGLEGRLFGKLSGGEKQRLLFALALCGDPDLLFLDEPTVGLDVASRRLFWEQIRRLADDGRTILLTTHYLEEADSLADRVVVIRGGRFIADGTPAEIKAQAAGRRLRCRTRLSLDELRGLPGVAGVRRDKDGVEVLTGAAEPLVRELLRRDPDVRDLEVTGAGLEEAFLSLTAQDDDLREKGAA